MRRALIAALVAGAALLAGCTGVPLTSEPQVVTPLGDGPTAAAPTIVPEPGADPRAIVKGFLSANASADEHHSGAKAFLTRATRNRWSDTTVTIIDAQTVGVYDPRESSVTVTGRQIGTINAVGIYSPTLKGDGNGGDTVSFTYGLSRENGQWRIDTLKNGLLITDDAFQETVQGRRLYQQYQLYFFDLAEKRLVPDPRYSALADPTELASFLVSQLANPNGSRPELQTAVTTELPAQSDPQSVRATVGQPTVVDLPGAGQLDPTTRNHLAAQLALTLRQVIGSGEIVIQDGGRQVPVPAVGSARFNADDFASVLDPVNATPALYYVRGGAVYGSDGQPITGPLGTGQFGLTSVALAILDAGDMLVAGTSGPPGDARLVVGSLRTQLRQTSLRGELSRPAWVPGLDEVWVGDGTAIHRATSSGRTSVVPVATTAGKVAGRVAALRFSPEGSRVAVVLAAPDGTSQVWLGSVVRTGPRVRVDNLEPISPLGIVVADVAWNDQLKLFVVGRNASTGQANVFEVQVDGSLWTPRSIANLPAAPDSITVAEKMPAWVSAGGTIWTQRGSFWSSPEFDNLGVNPVYVE